MKLIIITFLFINIYSSVYSNTIYYLTKIPNLKVHDINSSNGIKYLKAEKSFKVGIVENNVQCNKPSENDIKNRFKIIKKNLERYQKVFLEKINLNMLCFAKILEYQILKLQVCQIIKLKH